MSKKINQAAEAIQSYGSKTVADWQLLQAIGVPELSALSVLERANGSLANLARMTIIEIANIKGIGMNKATAIHAAIEIGRRRQKEECSNKPQIATSIDAFQLIHADMRDLNQEVFVILLLDRRSRLLKIETIHVGGMAAMVVDPKIIFQKALEYKACSLILAHNHPSGAPSPSIEDIRLTEKVKQAGGYLDIKVLDHLVIGDGSYYSFADEGKM